MPFQTPQPPIKVNEQPLSKRREIPGDILHLLTDKQPFFQKMRLLGQVQGTYIIAEYGEAVYIIDQHAAHERIRYEEIIENIKQKGSFSQKYVLKLSSLHPRRIPLS